MNRYKWSALVISYLAVFGARANAQGVLNVCDGMEVRSIEVSADLQLPANPGPRIDLVPDQKGAAVRGPSSKKVVKLVLFGPVLGSMDSREVKTDFVETPRGCELVAGITRSAEYSGAVAKNVLWRPRIEVAATFRRAEVTFQAKWVMRLTTGTIVDHARTPPYPDQKYPITLTKSWPPASD
jgi:hypothetical protein